MMARYVVILSIGLLSGCGPSGPQLVEIRGKVTLDGQALGDATVVITSGAGGRPASAVTGADGQFMTQTTSGPAKVGVLKVESSGGPQSTDLNSPPDDSAAAPRLVNLVPPNYNSPATSGLTITVPVGGGDVGEIKLSK